MGYFSIFAGKYINRYGTIQHKDAATHYWGEKWRTPTKEDFEELITKCKWEKYIISTTNQFALKAIGPNGNSIVFPVDLLETESQFSLWDYYGFSLWSSTKENNTQAYIFHFHVKVEFWELPQHEKTLEQQRKILDATGDDYY